MERITFRLCGVAAVFLSGSALANDTRADWQYTRWGMTQEQGVAASLGAGRLGPPPQGKTYENLTGRALGTHQADGATFNAYFHFDTNNGLAKVALERVGGATCPELHNELKGML